MCKNGIRKKEGKGRCSIVSDGKKFLRIPSNGTSDETPVDSVDFRKSHMYEFLLAEAKSMRDFVVAEKHKYQHISSSFEEYFTTND